MKRIIAFLTLSLVALSSQALGFKDDYTKTQYPIVLVHGLYGFDSIHSIDYFYRVRDALVKGGAEYVYAPSLSSTNSTEARGEQLLHFVKSMQDTYGFEKFNLIGHSHGGPTARYVAAVAPEMVASVTSIGGVNKGSLIADLLRSNVSEGSASEHLLVAASLGVTNIIEQLSHRNPVPEDGLAALEALTTKGSLAFNEKYPEGVPTSDCGEGDFLADNGVYYYSWTGASTATNALDPIDATIGLLGLAYSEPSDGVVGVCSTHLGKVIRDDYKMNHMDEINQTFGIHHLFETDPITLYRQHANRLKLQGL